MALIQVAIDHLDHAAAVALAEQVAPHVDILEIGTPCIKHNGIALLHELRRRFPGNRILVDLKTMDAGEYETTPFYAAGADLCTVLGTADDGTIRGAVQAATRFGKQCQVDLINVPDKCARAAEVAALGAHVIGVHTGLDQQASGQTPFADLTAIRGLGLDLVISVAGGIKRETVARALDAGAGIIVAGAAIYAAEDPVSAAIAIAEAARAPRQRAA
ncbi:MAG TPA: 3-hexulose-6-phosphate synthase [Gammaproteobacteria bacterium]|nr:3-hexulose-6-phosphate synthase [Gammaproteobacteria bacterium]